MSEWVPVLLPVGAAALLFLAPGLLIGYAAGLRGLAAWGLAPALSTTAVASAGVLGPLIGVRLGAALVAGMTLGLAWVAAGVVRVAGARLEPPRPEPPRPEPRRILVAGLGAAAVGSVPIALAIGRAIGSPGRWPQTYDAVFHLSAIQQVLWTGNGSSRDLGTVAQPENSHAFYPAAWHDLVALVVQLTGTELVTAVTAVSLAMAALVWPLGCVFLVRQVLGPRRGPLLAAGLLSGGFAAAPYLLLSYGTVWPNALATVLLPSVLAVVATVLGLRPRAAVDGRRALLVGLAAAPGCVLAHPNAAVTAIVYGTVLAPFAGARWVASARRRDRTRRLAVAGVALVGLVLAVAWLFVASPFFATTRATNWPARGTVAQAIGEFIGSAPVGGPLPAVLAGLTMVGTWCAIRTPRLRWLVACHAAAGVLYVAARASDAPWAQALTGPWYNDAFRLAALGPVTGLPLAVLGVSRLVVWRRPGWLRREHVRWVLVLLVVLVTTQGMSVRDNARVLGWWYRPTELLGPAEEALVRRLPDLVPVGTVVAGNPWNGSALVQPLAQRRALFPHLNGVWGADRTLLATALDRAASDAQVCVAARRLGVGFVLDGPSTFWPGDRRSLRYPGLEVAGHAGFEAVATGGRLTLYRLTDC